MLIHLFPARIVDPSIILLSSLISVPQLCYNGNMFKLLKFIFKIIKLAVVVALVIAGINIYMIVTTSDEIGADISATEKPDCILVLGASVRPDGSPSPILRNRLDAAASLYEAGASSRILLSGDNGQQEYNEVAVMRQYLLDRGIPEEAIYLDHAGFSTYESVYRAREIFCVDSAIVVTQKYHLYRALYGCEKMGIEAGGVAAADMGGDAGDGMRDLREVFARVKDFGMWIVKPEPKYLGDKIPICEEGSEGTL